MSQIWREQPPVFSRICTDFVAFSAARQTQNRGFRSGTIICKRGGVVLLAEEDWQAIQETLFLLTMPGMRESIRATMAEPLQDSASELEW